MNLKTFLVSLLTVIAFSGCVSQNILNINIQWFMVDLPRLIGLLVPLCIAVFYYVNDINS